MSNNMNENENITKIYNQQSDISPISKMRIITADKTKRESQYWIEHFKYKQNLLNQLDMIKNENPDKKEKTLAISQFNKEQEILSDNLYKLKQITKYSQIKLGNNFNKMKKIENNEETQKQKLKEIYENNLEKIKNIEKIQENINIQKQLLTSWYENVDKMKNEISNIKKENGTNIDNLVTKYSEEDKEFKKNIKIYNCWCNIIKYKIIDIENNENKNTQEIKGYLLNAVNGNILNYNIPIKSNESVENKAIRVLNFWKNLINFNKSESN